MRKIITLIWVLFALPFFGQHKIAGDVEALVSRNTVFTHFSPLIINGNAKQATNKVVKNATYAVIDNEIVKRIADTQPQNIEINIPYNGHTIAVQLYRSDIFASGFHVDTNKKQAISYKKGAYYRGIIKGNSNSLASFSFFQDEMSGMISSPTLNNLIIGRLNREKNIKDYIIYSDGQLNIKNAFRCSVLESENSHTKNAADNETTVFNNLNTPDVKVSFEMDYELYRRNNSNEVKTVNWMTAVFNNIQTLFANDGISVSLASVFMWQSVDPYVNNQDSYGYLDQFTLEAVSFDGDVAQLIGIDGGQGGLAYLSGLCGNSNKSYCDVNLEFEEVPIFSWTVEAMTHELGHQFGSPHTHACAWNGDNTPIDVCGPMAGFSEGCDDGPVPYEEQGTIMSYCHLVGGVEVNLANGFGPQPAERIINYLNSVWCLEPLSVESNTFADFSYYPNPSTGLVNITSGDEIEELSVYNVAGQLLFTKKVNAAEAVIDLSSFANGVYFIKAVNGSKERNFRVVKQ